MKLLRFGPAGQEKPGLLDAQGVVRDLSAHVRDIDGDAIGPDALARLRALDPATLPAVPGNPRIGACVSRIGKFVCIGLNYADHAAESNMPIPAEPIVFNKWTSAVVGPNDDVKIPRGSEKTDWEVELGIVIGTKAQYVSEAKALDYVAGYCVVNDVSERDFQLERGSQWDRGKGCDTFGPVGPWLVTTDEITDPQTLDMWLDVNGEKRQRGNTKTMIFGGGIHFCVGAPLARMETRVAVSQLLARFPGLRADAERPRPVFALGTRGSVAFGPDHLPVVLG